MSYLSEFNRAATSASQWWQTLGLRKQSCKFLQLAVARNYTSAGEGLNGVKMEKNTYELLALSKLQIRFQLMF